MAKWKICRQQFGNEEFAFEEGDRVPVGRGFDNKITLSSIVVSRNHCVIKVQKDNILITDLNSSNGTYVGMKKIPVKSTFTAKDGDIIGFGWTTHIGTFKDITDNDKYVFKLVKVPCNQSIASRIQYLSDSDDNLESKIAALDGSNSADTGKQETEPHFLKRKSYDAVDTGPIKVKKESTKQIEDTSIQNVDVVNLVSDSDSEVPTVKTNTHVDKIPMMSIPEEVSDQCIKKEIVKNESDMSEYETFDVKQEYLGFDDNEAIEIDSDSDSESEQWLMRLSQSSPGKSFIRCSAIVPQQSNTSYSQVEEPVIEIDHEVHNEEEFYDDIISIPPNQQKPDRDYRLPIKNEKMSEVPDPDDYWTDEILNDIINYNLPTTSTSTTKSKLDNVPKEHGEDSVDGTCMTPPKPVVENQIETGKKAQLIEPLVPIQNEKMSEDPDPDDYWTDEDEILNDIINYNLPTTSTSATKSKLDDVPKEQSEDIVDGTCVTPPKPVVENQIETGKKAQLIEPLVQLPKRKAHSAASTDYKPKTVTTKSSSLSSSRRSKSSKNSTSKSHISNLQKEERKKKLKEIATKDKDDLEHTSSKSGNQANKAKVNAKVTSANRGAFLTDVQAVVKPMARKESPEKPAKPKKKKKETSTHVLDDVKKTKKKKEKSSDDNDKVVSNEKPKVLPRIPLKSLKPLSESEETGKPMSKVDPLPPKKAKKSVRFSNAPPKVHVFEIEPGNKMNKTSDIKNILTEKRQRPVFSLEKLTLMKILRWNPHWLDEQINNNEPPPILGHSNPPLGMFQAFESHHQYVGQVGDLLLMEIWECITQGYMRVRGQNNGVQMKIVSLPPPPPQSLDRTYDLFSITVEIALSNSEKKSTPRMGEIMICYFGPENAKNSRFLFVTNVQPPNNRHPYFTVSLHATFTEKMRILQPGQIMVGKSLAHIHKELTLFEAMEYLAGSPLSETILRPEPHHFQETVHNPECSMNSQWTKDLNDSQKTAVSASVSAALGDRPCIQMVQGPPGTGKSSVICAMVMAYYYDGAGRRLAQRGKILICATSNAAVDELVIRLLNIRQNLPRDERFRMVRVGRSEAMHPRARDVSSQTLAQRDARPRPDQPPAPALREEISRLDAKINMWRTTLRSAKDQSRAAYCQDRIKQFTAKRALLGGGEPGGGGEEPRAEDVARAERRIIDCADIVLTTLASAVNQKMRGLKRRIALCIIDEAGQAIEPEALIPLTLDVTRLALIGDPQQLPGYICSQRAKRHGLGDSLFSRLAGASEAWGGRGGAVLLDRQYRMHAAIADYPNRAFYAARVRSAAPPRPRLPVPPYTLLTISSGDKGQGACGGNEMEAWGVARLAAALREVAARARLSLAVITPYNAHKDLLKRNLRALLPDQSEQAVEVNTVDSFQGQERDIVVVSLARSQGVGFLTDAGRLNVMLTRARHALLVVLNPHAVMRNDQWRTLVEDAQQRRVCRSLPTKMCQPLAPGQPVGDILQFIQ